jgi:fucose permease
MDDGRVGRLIMVWQFTTLVATIVAGPMIDLAGHRWIAVVGFVLVAAAIFTFSSARTPAAAPAAAVVLGLGGSCVNAVGNTLLPALNPANPAAASNLGNVFFGLGAFTVPFAVAFLFGRVSYGTAVSVFGFIAAAAAAPAALADYPAVAGGSDLTATFALITHPAALLAGFVLFCYMGLEVSAASWTTTYLKKVGFDERRTSILFSLFWVMMIAGRLITSQFVSTGIGRQTIQIAALAAAGALLLMTMTMSRSLAGACAVLTGLFFAPIFPTTVGVTYARFDPSLYGSVFAVMLPIGLLGPSLVPPMIGNVAKSRGIHLGYRIMVALALVLFLLAFAL